MFFNTKCVTCCRECCQYMFNIFKIQNCAEKQARSTFVGEISRHVGIVSFQIFNIYARGFGSEVQSGPDPEYFACVGSRSWWTVGSGSYNAFEAREIKLYFHEVLTHFISTTFYINWVKISWTYSIIQCLDILAYHMSSYINNIFGVRMRISFKLRARSI